MLALEDIKGLLGIEEDGEDAVFSFLIENALCYIETRCSIVLERSGQWPAWVHSVGTSMVLEDYNKWGKEGLTSFSAGQGGFNYGFIQGYSSVIESTLRAHAPGRKMKML